MSAAGEIPRELRPAEFDKLTPDQRVNLEALSQAVAYAGLTGVFQRNEITSDFIVETAAVFARWIRNGSSGD